ncbi:unnamed protein product [Camellia sinensis]
MWASSTRRGGMTVLGKVAVPKPFNLPSQSGVYYEMLKDVLRFSGMSAEEALSFGFGLGCLHLGVAVACLDLVMADEMKDLKESVSKDLKDLKELVEAQRVSAEQKHGFMHGTSYMDKLGFASLTVWNMKTWKAMTVLPLGEGPPTITSLCFNHNGKILAAAATDGMIHMFDMSAGLQITGWPAHDSAINSVLFGPDETSIFSLGIDGKVFCNRDNSEHRHEMALDANGRRLLATSGSVRAPIYQGGSLYRLIHRADAGEVYLVDTYNKERFAEARKELDALHKKEQQYSTLLTPDVLFF